MDDRKKQILIVDDDSFLLDMYALKFSQNNFDVHTAMNGVQALEKIKGGFCPEIMLIDVIMPEMDGFEVLGQMQKESLCTSCRKIILSNKSQQSDVDQGTSVGAAGYIIKANSTPLEVVNQVLDIMKRNPPTPVVQK